MLTWRNYVPAILLLVLVMLAQILLADIPLPTKADQPANIQIVLTDPTATFGPFEARWLSDSEMRLLLEVDGQRRITEIFLAGDLFQPTPDPFFYTELEIEPTQHQIRLTFSKPKLEATFILFDQTVTLPPGRVFRLQDNTSKSGSCKNRNCLQ